MEKAHTNGEVTYSVALGGVGGDSHSVGLTILRQALTASGYRVYYLGTQNRLDDFFHAAALSDVLMISSMDGHVGYYLRGFPEMMQRFNGHRPLCYLGGNLGLGDGLNLEKKFLEMGFDRAFVKFVDVAHVLELLARDLAGVEPKADCTGLWEAAQRKGARLASPPSDEPLEVAALERLRREVLERWPTGRAARSLAANAEYLAAQPSFPAALEEARAGRRPIIIQPRSGVPLVREQIKLFRAFKVAGAGVLSYQVDSLTRNNNYAGAEEAVRDSRESGVATINGFPVINHGVPGLRRVMAETGLPLQTRHSTRDPRLLAEISYAGGVTSFEGGAVCYNIPYYKDYPLDESLRVWQYVDRLTGLYHERFGIVLDREYFGTLTATLIPPCLAIAVNIIEGLLAVRQGVKSLSFGYAEQGHRAQDIAAVRTLDRMAREALRNLGHKGVRVSTVFHQYMAAFPATCERSEELIYHSAQTAALSGAARVIVKTAVESLRIPTLEDNLHAINLVMRGAAGASPRLRDEERVGEECAVIEREVEAILRSVIGCGRGQLAEGVVEAFRRGYLDIPFSPSVHNRGEVLTARDAEGAVRFLSTGRLQFGRELREFHREKMQERRRAEGSLTERQNYLVVEQDVLRIARGRYEGWPLGG